ncbi:ABC transporter ATP-binding protein [Pararhodobacter oceanensis]|uniref:ABC transporter ATP-binding protein n=1 Tax=Pararhodobacter oceanensis TaxID=2172121 RepID=UPI003A8DACE3
MSAALELHRIGHAYFGQSVLDSIDLQIAPGEVVALVGPSGSGKSTLAHIAAGLVEPREGRVTPGYARHAMIFQEPRLLPWATAAQNIGFALRRAKLPRRLRPARVAEAARLAELEPQDLAKYSVELSGGMRQRVAIARALAVRPDFIFFDEPFTALDVALKRRMQDLVIAAAEEAQFAALFITHDLVEALRIAHRIAVLDLRGRGIAGLRILPGDPGARDEATTFALRQRFLTEDPLFRHIHDVDERRRP